MSLYTFRPGDRVRWFDRAGRPLAVVIRANELTHTAVVELEDGTRRRVCMSYLQRTETRPGDPLMLCEACSLTLDQIQAGRTQRCQKTRTGRHRWASFALPSRPPSSDTNTTETTKGIHR